MSETPSKVLKWGSIAIIVGLCVAIAIFTYKTFKGTGGGSTSSLGNLGTASLGTTPPAPTTHVPVATTAPPTPTVPLGSVTPLPPGVPPGGVTGPNTVQKYMDFEFLGGQDHPTEGLVEYDQRGAIVSGFVPGPTAEACIVATYLLKRPFRASYLPQERFPWTSEERLILQEFLSLCNDPSKVRPVLQSFGRGFTAYFLPGTLTPNRLSYVLVYQPELGWTLRRCDLSNCADYIQTAGAECLPSGPLAVTPVDLPLYGAGVRNIPFPGIGQNLGFSGLLSGAKLRSLENKGIVGVNNVGFEPRNIVDGFATGTNDFGCVEDDQKVRRCPLCPTQFCPIVSTTAEGVIVQDCTKCDCGRVQGAGAVGASACGDVAAVQKQLATKQNNLSQMRVGKYSTPRVGNATAIQATPK